MCHNFINSEIFLRCLSEIEECKEAWASSIFGWRPTVSEKADNLRVGHPAGKDINIFKIYTIFYQYSDLFLLR